MSEPTADEYSSIADLKSWADSLLGDDKTSDDKVSE
jgi:hypothetical protein